MDVHDLFGTRFFRGEDLSTPVVVTIKEVCLEALGQVREKKPVLYFSDTPKALVLNPTNGRMIATLAGQSNTDRWAGTVIELYQATTEFRGSRVPCVRVRAPHTKPLKVVPKKSPTRLDEDDQPSLFGDDDEPIPDPGVPAARKR